MVRPRVSIELDNEFGAFFAGQNVSGFICLSSPNAVRADDVNVKIKGRSFTEWSKFHGKTSTTYIGEEKYLESNVNVNLEAAELAAGTHRIPFSHPLDEHLPSSFEGSHGAIRYTLEAQLRGRGLTQRSARAKRRFSLVAYVDLNAMVAAGQAIDLSENRTITCCFRQRGVVDARLVVPKRGYVPGEQLMASVAVHNSSTKTIDKLVVTLKQQVTYVGQTTFANFEGRHESCYDVCKLEKILNLKSGDSAAVDDVDLGTIPPLPPCIFHCSLIDVRYRLEVDVGTHLLFVCPLIIGTMPSRTNGSGQLFFRRVAGLRPKKSVVVSRWRRPSTDVDSDVIVSVKEEEDDADEVEEETYETYDDDLPAYPFYSMSTSSLPSLCKDD